MDCDRKIVNEKTLTTRVENIFTIEAGPGNKHTYSHVAGRKVEGGRWRKSRFQQINSSFPHRSHG